MSCTCILSVVYVLRLTCILSVVYNYYLCLVHAYSWCGNWMKPASVTILFFMLKQYKRSKKTFILTVQIIRQIDLSWSSNYIIILTVVFNYIKVRKSAQVLYLSIFNNFNNGICIYQKFSSNIFIKNVNNKKKRRSSETI